MINRDGIYILTGIQNILRIQVEILNKNYIPRYMRYFEITVRDILFVWAAYRAYQSVYTIATLVPVKSYVIAILHI